MSSSPRPSWVGGFLIWVRQLYGKVIGGFALVREGATGSIAIAVGATLEEMADSPGRGSAHSFTAASCEVSFIGRSCCLVNAEKGSCKVQRNDIDFGVAGFSDPESIARLPTPKIQSRFVRSRVPVSGVQAANRMMKMPSSTSSAMPTEKRDSPVDLVFTGSEPSKVATHPEPWHRLSKNRAFRQPVRG